MMLSPLTSGDVCCIGTVVEWYDTRALVVGGLMTAFKRAQAVCEFGITLFLQRVVRIVGDGFAAADFARLPGETADG